MTNSIRPLYEQFGATGYYEQHGADYRNPHEAIIGECLRHVLARDLVDTSHVLDLACGSGEVTLVLQALGCKAIKGLDPFTYEAYEKRTGQTALRTTFEDIGLGALDDHHYSLIVCSFALHLAEPSRLPLICYHLSLIAPQLIILTPHKRPHIEPAWGWSLRDETLIKRVRTRVYESFNRVE